MLVWWKVQEGEEGRKEHCSHTLPSWLRLVLQQVIKGQSVPKPTKATGIRVAWGMTAPLKGEGHFGYDGFALAEIPQNHVVEKYVFYQRVNSCFMKICNVKKYVHYLNSTEKTVLKEPATRG